MFQEQKNKFKLSEADCQLETVLLKLWNKTGEGLKTEHDNKWKFNQLKDSINDDITLNWPRGKRTENLLRKHGETSNLALRLAVDRGWKISYVELSSNCLETLLNFI